jgi:hypothetical protein
VGEQEQLEALLRIEKFENGAHVRLVLRQRSDRPDEIELTVWQEPDSTPLDYCILTSTMGNMARTRLLWLKNDVVSCLELYGDYKETGFAPQREYSLSRLQCVLRPEAHFRQSTSQAEQDKHRERAEIVTPQDYCPANEHGHKDHDAVQGDHI